MTRRAAIALVLLTAWLRPAPSPSSPYPVLELAFGYARCTGVWGQLRCGIPIRPMPLCPPGYRSDSPVRGCDDDPMVRSRIEWARRRLEDIRAGWRPFCFRDETCDWAVPGWCAC